MNLIASGPLSTALKLDLLEASIIFFILSIMILIILLRYRLSLVEKFKLIGVPLSIIFVGLALSITMRLNNA